MNEHHILHHQVMHPHHLGHLEEDAAHAETTEVLLSLLSQNKALGGEQSAWDFFSSIKFATHFSASLPKCTGCGLFILDRYILKVLDNNWHSKCLKCAHCNESLKDKCFVRENEVFCKEDFFR